MATVPEPDIERLLAEDPFVRNMAGALLRDAHAAEDLAQETWLAALQHPALDSPRGWLAAVMQRIRGRCLRNEQRQKAREEAVARSERVPSTATIVAREALRAEVVRAVLDLDTHYRDVVLLRWFENLPPRAIAQRLKLPVETVRTRLKRALAILRTRLDDRHGRAAWCAMLWPLTRESGSLATASTGAGLLTSGLVMTTKVKVVSVTVALAGALAGALLVALQATSGTPPEYAPPDARDGAGSNFVTAAGPAAPAAVTDEPAGQTPDQARQLVAPASIETTDSTGSLLLRAVWGDDKTPAAGVVFDLWHPNARTFFEVPRAATDASGQILFDRIRPGRVSPRLMRGETGSVRPLRIDILPGQRAEEVFELPIGINAKGRVVDDRQRGVAGAEILASGYGQILDLPVARCDADGRFDLRAVGNDSKLGARAPGYAPSPRHLITGSEGGTVELTIVLGSPGATVSGVVLDPQGQPVPGAVLEFGDLDGPAYPIKLPDGSLAAPPAPQRTRSREDGSFSFDSVPPGQNPLQVCAVGLAPWRQEIAVWPRADNKVTVHLLPGVTMVGTVTEQDGKPVADARVAVSGGFTLPARSSRSLADGTFSFEGLAAGELTVVVLAEGVEDRRTVHAVAGETVRCDVRLRPGLDLRGRVVDTRGDPVERVRIDAHEQKPAPGKPWWASTSSDAEGRFALKNCKPSVPIRISMRRKSVFPELTLSDVVPSPEELVVRLPKERWIHIRGTILGPDGSPVSNVHISPFKKGDHVSPMETNDAQTGAFELGPYPPGEYGLRLAAWGYPSVTFPMHAIGPGEVWDVGTVRLERGGFADFALVDPSGAAVPSATLTIHNERGKSVRRFESEAGKGRAGPLRAGNYTLQVKVPGMACMQQPFSVHAGVTTKVDVVLQPGAPVEMQFDLPDAAEPPRVTVIVVNEHEKVVLRATAWSREGSPRLEADLLPGSYRVHAENDRAIGGGTLRVETGGTNRATITLQQR